MDEESSRRRVAVEESIESRSWSVRCCCSCSWEVEARDSDGAALWVCLREAGRAGVVVR